MDYSFLRGRYESRISIGKVDSGFQDFRPFAWSSSVEFSLGSTFADVKTLKWNSGRSSLQASGRISDFRDPRLDASYEGHFDLAEAAAIARRYELREGVAEFSGSGHWSLEDFTAAGALALRDLGWQNDQMVLKKANANSDYSITDEQIRLSRLQGKLLGGSFTGDVQVDNWLHSIPPPEQQQRKAQICPWSTHFVLIIRRTRRKSLRASKTARYISVCGTCLPGNWRTLSTFQRINSVTFVPPG